ncbi:MAG: hypothetical protein ACSHWY_13620 [Octadecabacter sp.]
MRFIFPFCAMVALTACETVTAGASNPLSDTRVTLLSDNPDAGPIIFEFYSDGTALLAFDETADRGQRELRWRIDGTQLCLSSQERPRDECQSFSIQGATITLGTQGDMIGSITPL